MPSRPSSVRRLVRAVPATVALAAGVLGAIALSGGGAGHTATADDIPIYTATTPTVYTAPTIPVDTSTTIDPVQAAQIAFYKATIIKPLPPAPPIRRLPAAHWGISVPAHCDALCVYAGTIIAYNIGVWYSEAGPAKARTATLGKVTVTGNGTLNPRITIAKAYRALLLRSRRPVRVTIVRKVTAQQYGFTKTARQTLVLRPR